MWKGASTRPEAQDKREGEGEGEVDGEAGVREERRMRVMRHALWYRTVFLRNVACKPEMLGAGTIQIRARIAHIFQRKTPRGGLPSFTEEETTTRSIMLSGWWRGNCCARDKCRNCSRVIMLQMLECPRRQIFGACAVLARMCDNVVGAMKVATDLHDNEGKKLVQGKSKDLGQNMAEAWRTLVAADTSRAFFYVTV